MEQVKERKKFTYNSWVDTGRFTPLDRWKKNNPTVKLNAACHDIVVYHGGLFIQVLKDDMFYVDKNNTSTKLKEMEQYLWEQNKNQINEEGTV